MNSSLTFPSVNENSAKIIIKIAIYPLGFESHFYMVWSKSVIFQINKTSGKFYYYFTHMRHHRTKQENPV